MTQSQADLIVHNFKAYDRPRILEASAYILGTLGATAELLDRAYAALDYARCLQKREGDQCPSH